MLPVDSECTLQAVVIDKQVKEGDGPGVFWQDETQNRPKCHNNLAWAGTYTGHSIQ